MRSGQTQQGGLSASVPLPVRTTSEACRAHDGPRPPESRRHAGPARKAMTFDGLPYSLLIGHMASTTRAGTPVVAAWSE